MSRSTLFITTFCISLVLVFMVMIPGCTTTPSNPLGTIPETTLPSTTVSPLSSVSQVPASTSNPDQAAATFQLKGNVYGLSSNPQVGIDTITFTIGLASQAPTVDLTRMQIVFSTTGTAPVILTHGTRDSTRIFTTTMGNYAITSIRPGDEVEISFRVNGVPAGATANVELRPPAGAALPFSMTVPAMVTSMNVLH